MRTVPETDNIVAHVPTTVPVKDFTVSVVAKPWTTGKPLIAPLESERKTTPSPLGNPRVDARLLHVESAVALFPNPAAL